MEHTVLGKKFYGEGLWLLGKIVCGPHSPLLLASEEKRCWVREDALPRPTWWFREPLFYLVPYFTVWTELSYRTTYWIIFELFVHLSASPTSLSTAWRERKGFILLPAPEPSTIWLRMEAHSNWSLPFWQLQLFNPNAIYEYASPFIFMKKNSRFHNLAKCERPFSLLPLLCVASSNLSSVS